MMDTEEREKLLRQAILLSEDAKTFKESDLYAAMAARAEGDEVAAIADLCNIDASKVDEVRDLQSRIERARSFTEWIDDLICEGDQAYVMYVDENTDQSED